MEGVNVSAGAERPDSFSEMNRHNHHTREKDRRDELVEQKGNLRIHTKVRRGLSSIDQNSLTSRV